MSRAFFYLACRCCLIGVLLIACCLVYSQARADYIDDEELEGAVRQAEEELFAHKKRISLVQRGLERQMEAIDSARSKEAAILDELASFDEQIMEESRLLVEYFQQAQKQKELTREKEKAYNRLEIEKDMLRVMTQRRLAAYYRMGDIGVLNITFSAASLPDLVNFHEYYRHLLRHDRVLIDRFRTTLVAVEEAHVSHEQQRLKLEDAMDQARSQRDTLAAAKDDRRALLARVKVEKGLHQQASLQLVEAVDALMANLQDLEKQADIARQKKEEWMVASYPLLPHKKRKPAWLRGFGGQQGTLIPPVKGEVIVLFQASGVEPGAVPGGTGIDFKVGQGTEVRAIFRGKVIYAGFVKGYGQVVIISHSDGYYTLTSGVSSFLVDKGDVVQAGDVLALTSDHVGVLAEPVHFEIRRKAEVLDPLQWLDAELVVLAENAKATLPGEAAEVDVILQK